MGDLPNLANQEYIDRVNRAIDHVLRNLSAQLKLEDVARVATFSPYHFHRIFKSITGETLNDFTKRVRLERAIYLMSHRDGVSMTEIALACGFSSGSDFSRSFRSQYGCPPSEFDVQQFRDERRGQMEASLNSSEVDSPSRLPAGENPDGFEVTLRDLPPRRVAYLRVHRPYEGDGVVKANERLVEWARERGLSEGQWLGYQWDDPEIVPLEKCGYDVGVEIPENANVDGDISVTTFSAMKVAELEIKGSIELEMRALDWLYSTWLPSSGFAPDHQPGFEAWNGLPFAHGFEHFEVALHLPVIDASLPL